MVHAWGADTPCTTVGLWKYAAAYDIFKDVAQEDVEASLQLEGAGGTCCPVSMWL